MAKNHGVYSRSLINSLDHGADNIAEVARDLAQESGSRQRGSLLLTIAP
jgi:hypothetical protein